MMATLTLASLTPMCAVGSAAYGRISRHTGLDDWRHHHPNRFGLHPNHRGYKINQRQEACLPQKWRESDV
jgi:hypothetical protein